jgi:hypothetical protein
LTEKLSESFKKKADDRCDKMEYVIQVDHEFVDRIDDIVKSLELSNYKVIPDKKKQR